ncbi:MAG: GNAT family N-acetyltransferase [Clostridia bacterium]|nr:GNAT family N-acetyltransferase [Clostridia bacterium]
MLTEITIDTARERLASCSPALYREILEQMQVPPFLLGRVKAYEREAVLAVRLPLFCMGSFDADSWVICALRAVEEADDAGIEQMIREIRPLLREGDSLSVCVPGKLPEKWIPEEGVKYYSALGAAGETDPHIRELEDIAPLDRMAEDFFPLTEEEPGGGREYARMLVNDMTFSIEDRINTGETDYRIFGWWDGDTLAGAVSVKRSDVILICNLYVLPRYRRMGIGRALLRAALTLYPGETYAYSHVRENENSGKTARSAGFVPEGETGKLTDTK